MPQLLSRASVSATGHLAPAALSRHDGAMRRVHVIVHGMVQGVGYRYTLRIVAREVGVAGWVRNLPDGSVEAEVEGTAAQVDEVIAWMAHGPPGAHVDTAIVTDAAPSGAAGFDVLPTA